MATWHYISEEESAGRGLRHMAALTTFKTLKTGHMGEF
jgi:hypothetical protein